MINFLYNRFYREQDPIKSFEDQPLPEETAALQAIALTYTNPISTSAKASVFERCQDLGLFLELERSRQLFPGFSIRLLNPNGDTGATSKIFKPSPLCGIEKREKSPYAQRPKSIDTYPNGIAEFKSCV